MKQKVFIISLLFLALFLFSEKGLAQGNDQSLTENKISGTAKGIIGTALISGELAIIIQYYVKVKNKIVYYCVFGGGIALGAVGGYFIEQASGEAAIAMLFIGLAGIIPALIFFRMHEFFSVTKNPPGAGLINFNKKRTFVAFPQIGIKKPQLEKGLNINLTLLSGIF